MSLSSKPTSRQTAKQGVSHAIPPHPAPVTREAERQREKKLTQLPQRLSTDRCRHQVLSAGCRALVVGFGVFWRTDKLLFGLIETLARMRLSCGAAFLEMAERDAALCGTCAERTVLARAAPVLLVVGAHPVTVRMSSTVCFFCVLHHLLRVRPSVGLCVEEQRRSWAVLHLRF